MSGKLRENIMSVCPEEFEDKLKDFIDDVESRVIDIANMMDIKRVSDIDQIDSAHTMATSLEDDLY